jgi:Pyruvate/2-oxoacid:ferredoxin oxidoreductase gamma subunit
MSLKGKIRRASNRARALQEKAEKKEEKGKYKRAEKLKVKAKKKKLKAAGLAAKAAIGKAAPSFMMGAQFGMSGLSNMRSDSSAGDKKLNKPK